MSGASQKEVDDYWETRREGWEATIREQRARDVLPTGQNHINRDMHTQLAANNMQIPSYLRRFGEPGYSSGGEWQNITDTGQPEQVQADRACGEHLQQQTGVVGGPAQKEAEPMGQVPDSREHIQRHLAKPRKARGALEAFSEREKRERRNMQKRQSHARKRRRLAEAAEGADPNRGPEGELLHPLRRRTNCERQRQLEQDFHRSGGYRSIHQQSGTHTQSHQPSAHVGVYGGHGSHLGSGTSGQQGYQPSTYGEGYGGHGSQFVSGAPGQQGHEQHYGWPNLPPDNSEGSQSRPRGGEFDQRKKGIFGKRFGSSQPESGHKGSHRPRDKLMGKISTSAPQKLSFMRKFKQGSSSPGPSAQLKTHYGHQSRPHHRLSSPYRGHERSRPRLSGYSSMGGRA